MLLDPRGGAGNIPIMGISPFPVHTYLAALLSGLLLYFTTIDVGATSNESVLLKALRIDYTQLLEARSGFEQARRQGRLDRAEESDYADWIRQLGDRVLGECVELAHLSTSPLPDDLPCDQMISNSSMPAAIDLSAESTETEKTGQMIEQMNATLGEFDEGLLREQERIKAQQPRTDSARATGNSGMSAEGAEGQADSDASAMAGAESPAKGAQGETQAGKPVSGQEQAETGKQGNHAETSRQGAPGGPKAGADADIPDDIPDGSDDDVVARQLREAAEKEQDPELREKLWEEYRRYKSGTH